MQLTIEVYEQANSGFIARLNEQKDKVLSVYLFGSMARGEAIPGYSDLDYWIFLQEDVILDFNRFHTMLTTLISASQEVQKVGIPVFNVCCYERASHLSKLPVMLYSNLQNTENSKLVLGKDVRPQMAPNPVSQWVNQASSFLAMRHQLYHPLTAFLGRQTLNKAERNTIIQALQYAKYLPEAACAGIGSWPGERSAQREMAEQFPTIDSGILKAVRAFCAHEAENAATARLLEMLQMLLDLVEAVHEALQDWKQQNG